MAPEQPQTLVQYDQQSCSDYYRQRGIVCGGCMAYGHCKHYQEQSQKVRDRIQLINQQIRGAK